MEIIVWCKEDLLYIKELARNLRCECDLRFISV